MSGPIRRSADGSRAAAGLPGVVAAVALVVVAVVSVGALGGPLPIPAAAGHGSVGDVPGRTPDPVKVFQPAQTAVPDLRGTIVFAKGGNLWSVSGSDVLTQLTSSGRDSSPVWSRDGRRLYFVRTDQARGDVPCFLIAASGCIAATARYTLDYPVLSSMPAAGGSIHAIASGLYTFGGRFTYFHGLYQPALSRDGRQVAVVTDAPDPFVDDYGIALIPATGSATTGTGSYSGSTGGLDGLTRLPLPAEQGLGLNDPTWSPDGRTLAFTENHREGAFGRPRIELYDTVTGRTRALTGYGYGQPSYSPDGRYIVAVRSDLRGRDVVILDASTGAEILRVTGDGRSFAPVWSPAGDQIAFLRVNGLTVDLWVATLTGAPGSWSVSRTDPLTSQSRLDGISRPAWFIPGGELASMASPLSSGSPSGAASGAPASGAPASGGASGAPASTAGP